MKLSSDTGEDYAENAVKPLSLDMGSVKQHDFQNIKQKTDLQLQEELSARSNEELIEMNIRLLRLLSLYVIRSDGYGQAV